MKCFNVKVMWYTDLCDSVSTYAVFPLMSQMCCAVGV